MIAKTLTLLSFGIPLCLLSKSGNYHVYTRCRKLFFFSVASVFRHTSLRFSKLLYTGNGIRTTKSHFLSNNFYSSLLVPFRYAASFDRAVVCIFARPSWAKITMTSDLGTVWRQQVCRIECDPAMIQRDPAQRNQNIHDEKMVDCELGNYNTSLPLGFTRAGNHVSFMPWHGDAVRGSCAGRARVMHVMFHCLLSTCKMAYRALLL